MGDFLAADDPEHVEAPQGIDTVQTLVVRERECQGMARGCCLAWAIKRDSVSEEERAGPPKAVTRLETARLLSPGSEAAPRPRESLVLFAPVLSEVKWGGCSEPNQRLASFCLLKGISRR